MLDITVSANTSASPEQVIAATTDFSEERVKVWANSKPAYFQAHDLGAHFAEVTEGFRPPFGRVWERSRYEGATIIVARRLCRLPRLEKQPEPAHDEASASGFRH